MDKASLIERVHSWRRILSQDIYAMSGQIEEVSRAAQRFLCRAIISQMLVSKGILPAECWIFGTRCWVDKASLLEKVPRGLYEPYPTSSIRKVQEDIARMDLSRFPFEILSDIHETYLTRKLIVNSTGELEYLPEGGLRKRKGIYYTPRYIVRYIVDRTLGRYLWGTESGRPERNMTLKKPEDIRDPGPSSHSATRDLRILDPACGSGSFLAYVFDVLAEFYALQSPDNGTDWPSVILENHLYGIDMDGDAVDITRAILTLKALEHRAKSQESRARTNATRRHGDETVGGVSPCPLVSLSPPPFQAICPNIRQGNFLISSAPAHRDLETYREPQRRGRTENDTEGNYLIPPCLRVPVVPCDRETDMPEVTDSEGFAMILGNPPYGAKFTKAERERIKADYETHRSSDSSSLFVEKAVRMLRDKGLLGFIVPKSLSYVVSWQTIREFLLNQCRILEIADAMKAFSDVRLEQVVIIAQKRAKKENTRDKILGSRLPIPDSGCQWQIENRKSKIENLEPTVVSILRPEHAVVSHSIDTAALSADRFSMWFSSPRIRDIVDRIWEKSIPLSWLAEIWSGINTRCWIDQQPAASSQQPVRPCLRGRDIQRYHIRPGIKYIKTDTVKHQHLSLETFCRPKIVAQDIVAHIKNPRPHIKLMATIDRSENWLNVNTVTNINSSEYHLEYLCAILNSRLISWYAYDFIYNRAVRTMHFRRGYADHIPIRRIDQDDPRCKLMYEQLVEYVNRMIALYEVEQAASLFHQGATQVEQAASLFHRGATAEKEIAALDRKIDGLIYELYGITDDDIRFLRRNAGLH